MEPRRRSARLQALQEVTANEEPKIAVKVLLGTIIIKLI